MACPHPYLCGCGMAVQVAFGTPVGCCNGGGSAPPDLPRKFAASVRKIPVPWLRESRSNELISGYKVEQHVCPKIAEARDTTLKALKEAEQGWQRAIAKIGERAGLAKGADGTWRDPSISEAA